MTQEPNAKDSESQVSGRVSNQPNLNQIELSVLDTWQSEETFQKSLQQTEHGKPYVFYDGPPFATGVPHHGHLLTSYAKDAYARYHTMKGEYVRRRWGWDCHGLPIENIVEKELGISGKKQIEEIGVAKFNETCAANIDKYADVWRDTVNRVGRWVEYDNAYRTMDSTYQESVWWALKQIWDKSLIYEDRKVLLYCSRCETPLSNFEVAMDNSYRDVTDNSVVVKFRLQPRQRIVDFLTTDQTYVLAWTTTPWTLPGNTALNIGPDIRYVLARQGQSEYVLAKDRLPELEGEYEVLLEFAARSLEGLVYEPPYAGVISDEGGRAHRIYAEEFVTTTDGTGVVHNAAMYGEDDYQAAKRRDLPRVSVLDHSGRYLNIVPEFLRGQYFTDANHLVLQDLEVRGLAYRILPHQHSYPHCHRCATPLYYNAAPAWFINIQKIKDKLIANNEQVSWYPEHLKHGRFLKGLENAPDWNISRNRFWATALPFWRCTETGCRSVVCLGSIDELRQRALNFAEVYPNDTGRTEDLDLHKPYIDQVVLHCPTCPGIMRRVPEVVDCWVESGSMPFAELHYPFENKDLFAKRFPADFVVEYIPQTRAWFYVMHVLSTILFDRAPFRNVIGHGTILAEDGTKMSKSKKNYPDPASLIENFGSDALRWYMLGGPVMRGEDLNFSETQVAETVRKFSLILWNTWTFFRLYTTGSVGEVTLSGQHVMDSWVLARLDQVRAQVTTALDEYDSAKAVRVMQDWVTDLSTWYVRRSRDRFREGDEAAKQALGYALLVTCQLLAPLMPFLAEHIYRDLTGGESVHLSQWPEAQAVNQTILPNMADVRQLVELGLSVRKDQNLKLRQPLAEVQYILPGSLSAELETVLAEELNVKRARLVRELPSGVRWATKQDSGAALALDTEISEDLRQEALARDLERLVQDLRKTSGMQVGQMVDLYFATTDRTAAAVLQKSLNLKKLSVRQVLTDPEVEAEFEVQHNVGDAVVWLGLNSVANSESVS